MPVLPFAILKEIEGPIAVEELGTVLNALPLGKSPGPDGFTNAYYKKNLYISILSL